MLTSEPWQLRAPYAESEPKRMREPDDWSGAVSNEGTIRRERSRQRGVHRNGRSEPRAVESTVWSERVAAEESAVWTERAAALEGTGERERSRST